MHAELRHGHVFGCGRERVHAVCCGDDCRRYGRDIVRELRSGHLLGRRRNSVLELRFGHVSRLGSIDGLREL